jgi:hypothetical protein
VPEVALEVPHLALHQRRFTMSNAWDATKDAASVAVQKVKDAG